MARSIENTTASLKPLATDDERTLLELAEESAQYATKHLAKLYEGIAAKAFGPESKP